MQPLKEATPAIGPIGFQSSSGQKAGCNDQERHRIARIRGFNPHPARRPDATWRQAELLDVLEFQSSSGQKAGCNAVRVINHPCTSCVFQSSSGQKAGCNAVSRSPMGASSRFQSSSGQKAGCNMPVE